VRTTLNPHTHQTWRLCQWDSACQVPVSTVLDGKESYCRWHAHCCRYPAMARNVEFFAEWLRLMQQSYPSSGWWGWEPDRLWPVLQGVETIWSASAKVA